MKKSFRLSDDIEINLGNFCVEVDDITKEDEKLLEEYQNSLKLLFGLKDLPCIKVAGQEMDIDLMQNTVKSWQQKFDNVVVFGTGGSSLGGQALYNIAHPGFNMPGSSESKYPQLYFIDNIDPETFAFMDDNINFERTGFVIISKSGSTIETLTQALWIIDKLETVKLSLKDHLVIITEDKESPLSKICKKYNLDYFVHDPKIGGRFSVFSNVAMFPAMLSGIDVRKVRKGAYKIFEDVVSDKFHPVLISALYIAKHLYRDGYDVSVVFTYADKLQKFGQWYRQLVAESLGKSGFGITPIHSQGTVDQHSQLQLYLDGQRNKFFTMVGYRSNGVGQQLKDSLGVQELLDGKTMGDVLFAEFNATTDSIKEKGLPIRSFILEKVDEGTVGELLMYFIIETIVLSFAMGINAFNQPAVERSKVLTREYLCKH